MFGKWSFSLTPPVVLIWSFIIKMRTWKSLTCIAYALFSPILAFPSSPGARFNPWPSDTGGLQNVFTSNRVGEIDNELWLLWVHSMKRLVSVFAWEKYLGTVRIRSVWWPATSVVCAWTGHTRDWEAEVGRGAEGGAKGWAEMQPVLSTSPAPENCVLRLMQGLGSDWKVHRKKLPFGVLLGTIVRHLWSAVGEAGCYPVS